MERLAEQKLLVDPFGNGSLLARYDLRWDKRVELPEAIEESRCGQLVGGGKIVRQQGGQDEPAVSLLGKLSHDVKKTAHPGFAAGKEK